jgi:hypothetical protein
MLPFVLSMDLQTMDDQTLMLELTLDFAKNPNKNNDNADQKQWQCCYQSGCYHLATTSCK